MATQNPLNGPPHFYFIDSPSELKHKLEVSEDMSVKEIQDLLSRTTGKFSCLIKGTRRPPHPKKGYTNEDAPWRYRLSRADGSHHPGLSTDNTLNTNSTDQWRIFQSGEDLKFLLEQLQPGNEAEGGFVEFQHSMQLFRDQRAQARAVPAQPRKPKVNPHKAAATQTGPSMTDPASPSFQTLTAILSSHQKASTTSDPAMPNNSPDANLKETERYLAREAAVSSPIIVDGSLTQGRSDHVGPDRRSQIGFLEASLTSQAPRQHETPTDTNTAVAQQGWTSATVHPRLVRPSSCQPGLPIALGGGVQQVQAPQSLQNIDTYQYNIRNLRWPLPADQSNTDITNLVVVPRGSQAGKPDHHGRVRGGRGGRGRGGRASAGGETAQRQARYPPQSQVHSMNRGPPAQSAVGRVDPGIQWARQGHFGPPGPSFHGPMMNWGFQRPYPPQGLMMNQGFQHPYPPQSLMMNRSFQGPYLPQGLMTNQSFQHPNPQPTERNRRGRNHRTVDTHNRTSLRTTADDPSSAQTMKEVKDDQGPEKPAVKLPQPIQFGSAPHVLPVNLDLPESGPKAPKVKLQELPSKT